MVIFIVALFMLTKPLWPIAEYIVNYDYIVKNLCENKERPTLKCNGKCYLTKQLARESEGKDKNPFQKKQSKTEIHHTIFFQQLVIFDFKNVSENTFQNNYKTSEKLNSLLFAKDIAPPPKIG